MSDLDSSRTRLLPGFTSRRIVVPTSEVAIDDHGSRSFELQTLKGPIQVCMCWYGWHCKGRKDAFLDYGLIAKEWLPGAPGNNKISQTVLLMPDGQVALWSSRGAPPRDVPDIRIQRVSTHLITVRLPYTEAEQCEEDRFRAALKKQQEQDMADARATRKAWTDAKHTTDPDEVFAIRWRNSLLDMVGDVGRLIDGKVAFRDFPKLKLTGAQLEEVRDLVSQLEKAIAKSRPTLPIVKVRPNVIGLDRRAYEHI